MAADPPEPKEVVVAGDELDELHESIFGPTDLGPGKRYERLVALIFATLGEKVVHHDVKAAGTGKRTKHQIDVWIERDGEEQLVIVECKHWKEEVGKEALDKLVGVRTQLDGAGAVIATTVGFTRGARDVAFDEGIGLIRLTRFRDPEDWEGMVKEIRGRGTIGYCEFDNISVRAADPDELEKLEEEDRQFGPFLGEERFLDAEGVLRESIGELIDSIPQARDLGTHARSLQLEPDRFFELRSGRRLRVRALEWDEVVGQFHTEHRIGPRSPAQALVREIDPETGEATSRRAVFDHQLRRLRIDDDGNVRRI
ncbi:MAG TPA: restriction endonuclease [Solirubrobacterales bacterium]|nr:restriction endonuclease [Solirubrobacterales bacterium]